MKLTIFSLGVLLKFVPVIVTVVPSAPVFGAKPEIVGNATTIKSTVLIIGTLRVVTEIFPVAAPEGTEVLMLVEFEEVMVALMPLKETVGEGPKFVPVIMTTAPGAPLKGLNSVNVGVG